MTPFFWDTTLRQWVIGFRPFEATLRAHLQASKCLKYLALRKNFKTRKTSVVIRITTSALPLINRVDYKIICFQANLEPLANNNKTTWKRT